MPDKINLREKLATFDAHYEPKIIAELNGQMVKLVKFKGPFVWHHHDNEDELFMVVKGQFTMQLHGRNVVIREGELIVIPRGVEHCPLAEEEVHVMLFEPATTLNTGNVVDKLTQPELQRI